MNFIKDFFSDDSGASMMRLLSFLSLIIAGGLAYTGKDVSVSVFVIAAFGGKVLQKHIETKSKN